MSAAALFGGPGEARGSARAICWRATALGSPESWPQSLRTAVRLCLDSPVAMCVWAGPALQLIYNERYATMLGPGRHPWAMGRPGREVWGRYWEWLGPELERVTKHGESAYHEDRPLVIHRGEGDEEIYLSYSHTPIRDEDGHIVGSLNVVQETTERVRTLQGISELRAAQLRLAESDRRKTDFLAVLSHELRNSLAPFRTGLEILSAAPDATDRARRAREIMGRQLGHMVRLIDDLLDITCITRGIVQLRRERVSVRTVIDSAVEASRPQLDKHRHALFVELPEEPLWLDGDPTRLVQIVTNLLANAVKYTPDEGRIELHARREASEAIINVSDNGMGLSPEMLERVFDMFEQVKSHLHRSAGGLGIGLALVRQLAEMHGGSITAASPGPDMGSTFTLRLPLANASSSRAELIEACSPVVPLRRVLVVDDDVDAADALAMLLEQSGHCVSSAYDAESALVAVGEFGPEVVFCDLGMPGVDGYEVARRIRSDERLRAVVLVSVSGWGSGEDRRRAQAAGFDGHLTKPVGLDELRRWISRAPDRSPSAERRL